MQGVESVKNKPDQGLISKVVDTITDPIKKTADAFDSVLTRLLKPDAANQVNEEELFAGIIEQRIEALKGSDAAQKYHDALAAQMEVFRRADGYTYI